MKKHKNAFWRYRGEACFVRLTLGGWASSLFLLLIVSFRFVSFRFAGFHPPREALLWSSGFFPPRKAWAGSMMPRSPAGCSSGFFSPREAGVADVAVLASELLLGVSSIKVTCGGVNDAALASR